MDYTKLTEEQQEFLEECEMEFADRYTEKDKEYIETRNAKSFSPPILTPWEGHARHSSHSSSHHSNSNKRRYHESNHHIKAKRFQRDDSL